MSADHAAVAAPSVSPRTLLVIFTVTIFLSAALLFAVQPMFAKMVLPRLGGSPAVWSVAMVFFQAVLLAGYAYAHLITRLLPGRASVFVHLAVTAAATLVLPLTIAAGWTQPPAGGEALWLLGLFAASIGLPFFALSANGPLLQAWFARTGHPDAGDPYFLYAASNAGSFLALLSYPFLIEPFSRLGQQTMGWSIGFYVLIAMIALCGVSMLRSRNALPDIADEAAAAPSARDALIWITLAAVPSALLIAVTAHISTDVAASPFMWVVPLALYIATFVIVFQSKPLLPHRLMSLIHPLAVILLVVWYAMPPLNEIVWAFAANVVGFFVLTIVAHGELARRRPPARYLTVFYLCLSLGGVLGGVFAGFVALRLFSWVAEYPLLIIAAALCRPGWRWPPGRFDLLAFAAAAAAIIAVLLAGQFSDFDPTNDQFKAAIVVILLVALLLAGAPLRFGAVIALAFVFAIQYEDRGRIDFVRSFFGVHKISEVQDGQFRVLHHGTTEHGAQRIRDENGRLLTGRPEVLTYYHSDSPMAQGLVAARESSGGPIRIAVVGLGTGSLACQTKPEDTLHYYEIDAAVVPIARDRFGYLSNCAPDARIVLGDARLTLQDARDGAYDILIVDAFSSDAIPTHLLTKEAMALFIRKVTRDGMVLMHVSNKHMSLEPVVAGVAQANGLVALTNSSGEGANSREHKYTSTVVAVAREQEDFGALASSEQWTPQEPDPNDWLWTDDYSNVIGAVLRMMRGE